MNSIFEKVKNEIPVTEAAKHYGLTVNQSGMCRCLFHTEQTPSMKLNRDYFYCFGCRASGDVVNLTAQLFGLSPYETAKKLAADFSVNISEEKQDSKKTKKVSTPFCYDQNTLASRLAEIRRKADRENLQVWIAKAENILTDYLRLMGEWKTQYAPRNPDEEWHPLFAEALEKEEWIWYLFEQIDERDENINTEFYRLYNKEVKHIEERINQFNATGNDGSGGSVAADGRTA